MSSTSTRRFELQFEIRNLKKDGKSIDEYFTALKMIVDKLAAIGEMSQIEIRFLIYCIDLVQNTMHLLSINNRPDDPSIEEVHSLLMSRELTLHRQNSIGQLNLPPAQQKNKGHYNQSLTKFFNARQNYKSENYKQRYQNSSQPSILGMPQDHLGT
ncbi:uncharacterized protein Fot_35342 [Forsythia ovata]|uniref:Retrotransposon gag domain-containing protein n=1 Tax=Forsythia ovata TaxID=205694 RepID=A0ABD1SMP8_9LAMI